MITQHESFQRTFYLAKKFLRPEKNIILFILVITILKNISIIPVPYLVQMLINDYLNLNLKSPLFIISSSILFLLFVFYGADNFIKYLTEILKRRLFIGIFYKIDYKLNETDPDKVNFLQVPRFLEISFAKEELADALKNVGQTVIVIIFGTLIIVSFHPAYLVYMLFTLTIASLIIFFLYPRALLFESSVSDIKYKINEFLIRLVMNPKNDPKRKEVLAGRFLRSSSSLFRILFTKSFLTGTMVATAQGVFIYISGLLIIAGSISIGQFVAAELVLTYVLSNIYNFVRSFEQLINIVVSLDKIESVLQGKI